MVSFGRSKNVGRPYADVVDALRTRGLEKARRREMHVDGIDIDMCGGLPFGVEVVLFAEKAVGVRAANICYSLSQSTTTRMNRVRQAFEPSIRRAFHLYWRWARGMTLGVRGLVTDKDQRNLCPRLAIAGWRGGTRRDGGRGSGSRTRGGGQYRNPGLFFNSRVSQRDHVALFIVRSFRQRRVPIPNREITAHGSFSLELFLRIRLLEHGPASQRSSWAHLFQNDCDEMSARWGMTEQG